MWSCFSVETVMMTIIRNNGREKYTWLTAAKALKREWPYNLTVTIKESKYIVRRMRRRETITRFCVIIGRKRISGFIGILNASTFYSVHWDSVPVCWEINWKQDLEQEISLDGYASATMDLLTLGDHNKKTALGLITLQVWMILFVFLYLSTPLCSFIYTLFLYLSTTFVFLSYSCTITHPVIIQNYGLARSSLTHTRVGVPTLPCSSPSELAGQL